MDALVPTNCRIAYRKRIILVTQRSPRAHPELVQLTAVQFVGCRATWTHLKHLGTRAGKEITFRVTTR